MGIMDFPQNPTDGMIFESSVGIFYQYSALTKSWYRISTPFIPMASPTNDGLMSSEDFIKLTGLIIPPPRIQLSFEDCDEVYSRGLLLLTGDKDGIVQVIVHPENLHENTAVIDFKIDTQKLVQHMLAIGTLRLTAPQGDQGEQGDSGKDGANALPVGPQGLDGKDGKNAPWPGTLSEETFEVAQQNRAIVDIVPREVSDTENYLTVYRANIGDPSACPDTILPKDVQSPWMLAFDAAPNSSVQITSSNTGTACGWACRSGLYYFDVDAIVQSIHTHWVGYLNDLKAQKEKLANDWLDAMMGMFNEQKSALCCAIEACKSRTRNVQTRQYIEQQRIQAALGGFQVIVGGEQDKEFPPMDRDGNCAWDISPSNFNLLCITDPDCKLDWQEICPDSVDNCSWRPWSNVPPPPAPTTLLGDIEGLASGSIKSATAQRVTSNIGYSIEVMADVPSQDEASKSATGIYTNGRTIEDGASTQWVWGHGDWVLMIWKCKSDKKFASRLYNSSHPGKWDFGGGQNATECFWAGEPINIVHVGPGMAFALGGSNELAGGRAIVSVM